MLEIRDYIFVKRYGDKRKGKERRKMTKWSVKMKRVLAGTLSAVLLCSTVTGCGGTESKDENANEEKGTKYAYTQELNIIDDNVRNYYEVFVYSFYDSDGDGIGDLNGVTEKLDYIQDMGFNGIWLMPIMPSPTYHKYDTTDYCDIDAQYGTLDDFKRLLEEAHKRGINVIIDFMINHTSTEHEWFQTAYNYLDELGKNEKPNQKGCPYVDYYHFVKKKQAIGGTYYQVGDSQWYYEGAFWEGMPDLNLEKKSVRKELEAAADFWLELGVDGFRMDGVKYYDGGEEKNIDILSWFCDYVKSQKEDAYIVSEVWDNYNIAAKYLESGVDSTFDFSMGQTDGIIASDVRKSELSPVGRKFADSMVAVQDITEKANPDATVAEFLTNHDTGRMANTLSKAEWIKMAYAMELFMSGNVFVYYGEDIGLAGAGKDENFRAPMYWSATDTTGMTNGPEDMDEIEPLFPSLEEQQKDETSINAFIKRCLRLRNENPEIGRGTIAVMEEIEDQDICAITKTYEDSQLVMLYNISQETKTVTVSKDTYGYEGIRGYVSADGTEVTLDGENVTLPPYSVVILS